VAFLIRPSEIGPPVKMPKHFPRLCRCDLGRRNWPTGYRHVGPCLLPKEHYDARPDSLCIPPRIFLQYRTSNLAKVCIIFDFIYCCSFITFFMGYYWVRLWGGEGADQPPCYHLTQSSLPQRPSKSHKNSRQGMIFFWCFFSWGGWPFHPTPHHQIAYFARFAFSENGPRGKRNSCQGSNRVNLIIFICPREVRPVPMGAVFVILFLII